MKTKPNLVAIGLFLAMVGTGFGPASFASPDGSVISNVPRLTGLGSPTLRFSSVSYSAAESAGSVSLTVWRLNDTNTPVSVDFATSDLSAKAGLDYTATHGTLVFAAGVTNQSITVPILNDGLVEPTESFRITLSNPVDAALEPAAFTTVYINDNDLGVQFQFGDYSVAEDAGAVLLGVVRGDDGTLPVTVNLVTTSLSAISGVDYKGITNTLTFGPTERLKRIPVPILNNNLKGANKQFQANLSLPTGANLGNQTTTKVTIVDNDPGAQFDVTAYSVAEDAGAVRIHILRGNDDTKAPMTVDYATSDLSAVAGLDYTGATNTLTFAPGEKLKVLSIPILNDGVKEGTETFRVTLSNPSGGVLGPRLSRVVTILDNDPGLGFESSSYSVWEKAKAREVKLVVVRGNDGDLGPISVDYATTDLTAKAGQDYQSISGTLEFQENETLKALTVPILRPTPTGGIKMFRVTLNNPTGAATLGTATTTVSIVENYTALTPPVDAQLTIRREDGVNVVAWTGEGQLQRADQAVGPWQTLLPARSPWAIQSPVPATFYKVKNTRPVDLYVPSSYDGQKAMPLVILLHMLFNTGADEEDYMKFLPLAESRGFLYCHPDATTTIGVPGLLWYGTDAVADLGTTGVDDVGYLRGLIEDISQHFSVDRKRIYLVGDLIGGFMSYRMACQSSDLIAGIATLNAATYLEPSRCSPSEPVNILHIHGTADPIMAYGGRALSTTDVDWAAYANLPPFPGAVKTVQIWAGYNGASNLVTDPAPSLDLTADLRGFDTVVTRYTSYPAGGAVELWTINGGGHLPPLSSEFSPRVIDWLLAHPKP